MERIRRAFVCLVLMFAAGAAPAQSKGDFARGEAKTKACADCHGSPERDPLPLTPWLAGQLEEVTVLQLFLIREGLREIPQMAGMLDKVTDLDFFDIAAYYARQAPPRATGAGDAALRARGAERSEERRVGKECRL